MESYDPILNPVLNRELRRTGGRVLITLGDQDIDLSPAFTIFLSTRDPTVSDQFLACCRLVDPCRLGVVLSPRIHCGPLIPCDKEPVGTTVAVCFASQVDFAPDLCSRVTFVNFTVTRSSLQSQCLNQVLKAERPDVDKKRSDLLKLQGKSTCVCSV